jgi:hypothetical protein
VWDFDLLDCNDFFNMKSLGVGDFKDEIKFYIFYRWVRYGPFCFCYRMRRLR